MFELRPRQDRPELLDSPDVSRDDLERSLFDLERINRWLGGRLALAPDVIPFLPRCRNVLDLGCGGGDIMRWLSELSVGVRFCGVDLNPRVVDIARERCAGFANIVVMQGDAVSLPFADGSFDLVISSTFLHHLGPDEAVAALKEADRVAARRVVVSDLVRGMAGLVSVTVIGGVMFGRLSRVDGPVSFRRAYTPEEMLDLACRAGMAAPKVRAGMIRMTLVSDKGCD